MNSIVTLNSLTRAQFQHIFGPIKLKQMKNSDWAKFFGVCALATIAGMVAYNKWVAAKM